MVDGWSDRLASYHYRCRTIAPLIGADIYNGTQNIEDYYITISQKAYLSQEAQDLYLMGKVRIFDVCDGEWLDKRRTERFWWIVKQSSAIVCSTQILMEKLSKHKPCYFIDDREDLSYCHQRKVHRKVDKPLLVWHGISRSFERVKQTILPYIIEKGLPLKVIGDKFNIYPGRYNDFKGITKKVEWDFDTVNDEIIEGDIGINPPWKKDVHKYKSFNKTHRMWALGLPVAHDVKELEKFLDYEERIKESQLKLKEVKEKWDVKISGEEWINVLKLILDAENLRRKVA
jgi:hypothetical protein